MSTYVRAAAALLAVVCVVVGVVASAPARAQDDARTARYRQDFEKKKRKVLVESGHRHLELGVWCRDKGLVSQASMELIRAVEVSEHRHPGAEKVLSLMRSLGEDWKKRRRTTHTRLLDEYDKRARKAQERARKDRFGLAEWAWGKGLDEGRTEFLRLLELADAPLELDRKGRIVLPEGELPEDLSAQIHASAVTINDRLYVRDRFLEKLPDVGAVHEVVNERFRVRSQTSREQAQAVLDCCTALLPVLTEDTGGRPQSRMNIFVFADRKTYEAYLEADGKSSHRLAEGLAISGSNQALVNGDGRDDDTVLGIALHEVSHLFMYLITRSMMPSWYAEGFAETYGGTDVWEWDGKELETGKVMAGYRLKRIQSDDGFIPLRTMFSGRAIDLINTDKKKAGNFYTQSWAFVRYMRHGAGDEVRERFELWEDMCRGKALGAVYDKPTEAGDASPSRRTFDEMFAADLDALEAGFREWLETL